MSNTTLLLVSRGQYDRVFVDRVMHALSSRFASCVVRHVVSPLTDAGLAGRLAEAVAEPHGRALVMALSIGMDGPALDEDTRQAVVALAREPHGVEWRLVDAESVCCRCAQEVECAFARAVVADQRFEEVPTNEIQPRSFNFIESRIGRFADSPVERAVLVRIIHSTADFGFEHELAISDGAVDAGLSALRGGASVVTDVSMVASGIGRLFGDRVVSAVSQPDAARVAAETGLTRSAAGMELLKGRLDGAVVVVGNAPTALMHCLRLAGRERVHPALIVGCPVGFVGAAESKEALVRSGLPHITIRGNRGGSTVAAAAVNALGQWL